MFNQITSIIYYSKHKYKMFFIWCTISADVRRMCVIVSSATSLSVVFATIYSCTTAIWLWLSWKSRVICLWFVVVMDVHCSSYRILRYFSFPVSIMFPKKFRNFSHLHCNENDALSLWRQINHICYSSELFTAKAHLHGYQYKRECYRNYQSFGTQAAYNYNRIFGKMAMD